MQNPISITILLWMLLLIAGQLHAAARYHYRVQVPADLSHFEVSVCFAAVVPKHLYLPDDIPQQNFTNIYSQSGKTRRTLIPEDQMVSLAGVKPGDCLHYTANFNGMTASSWFKSQQSTKEQILVTLDQWLWQPTETGGVALTVEFVYPANFAVSAPGRQLQSASGKSVYQFRPRTTDFAGSIAVGRIDKILRGDARHRIAVALLQGRQPYDHAKILRWVDTNIAALQQLYGHFPVTDLQLLVVPIGANSEPVPWGESTRGGGDAVHVYIDETRPLSDFIADWVLIHELSHLLHPPISNGGSWLSEGLASYYQNVLAARGGMLSEQQAWDNLQAGFSRGIKGTPAQQTLSQVAATMHKNHLFMRVYWSGAAISLLADSQLRMQTHNRQSLDTVLQQFAQCCLPADKEWTALALMQKFDAFSGTSVFTGLYQRYVNSTLFPQLQPAYLQLGLIPAADHIRMSPTAPGIEVRDAIMHRSGTRP